MDANLYTVPKDKSVITGKGFWDKGLFKLNCFLNETGSIVRSAHFKDSSIATLQGLFQSYFRNGKLESEGIYEVGNKNGVWQ